MGLTARFTRNTERAKALKMGATDRTVISGTVGRPTEHQQMLKSNGSLIRHRKVLNTCKYSCVFGGVFLVGVFEVRVDLSSAVYRN